MIKLLRAIALPVIFLIISIALIKVAVTMERDSCQALGAERVSVGRGYVCVTDDGRIVKP